MLTGAFIDGKTFQNRSVSSPAPVTIVYKMIHKKLETTEKKVIQMSISKVHFIEVITCLHGLCVVNEK